MFSKKRKIHFIYTVPRGSVWYRVCNRVLFSLGLPPLYRFGYDWLIPWKKPIRAPHSISYNILQALKNHYCIRFYSMYERGICHVKSGDLILAQPAPRLPDNPPREIDREAITFRTFTSFPDNKKIIIMPYSGDLTYTFWWKDLVRDFGENCLFFSGQIWFDRWEDSPFKDLSIKRKKRLNMGIDLSDYPRYKKIFNPKGQRGYLYVGHSAWYKNTKQLEKIAESLPGYKFGHIGGGKIEGWNKIADFADLTKDFMEKIAQDYDIFINVSSGDPQVTTVLEAMAFGFLVGCTPESGYEYPSIVKLDKDKTSLNIAELIKLQNMEDNDIKSVVEKNMNVLAKNYSWQAVKQEVLDFIKEIDNEHNQSS